MMKRSNFFTFLLLGLSAFLVMSVPRDSHDVLSWRRNVSPALPRVAEASDINTPQSAPVPDPSVPATYPGSSASAAAPEMATQSTDTARPAAAPGSSTQPSGAAISDTPTAASSPISMENTLFIGDSRTVGLLDYGQIKEPDYFCSIGMSVFTVQTETLSVPGAGKVTLYDLLENKPYDRVYIMLGINELGYPFEDIISAYSELIELIKEKAPNASIFLQANLHVTKRRSDRDSIYNNARINELNRTLEGFSDQETIFYIDANELFDDPDGALAADKSADGTHPYGKYYVEWAEWIVEKTTDILKEE
jgi:hypothetical protein